jgi:hypothetical protein
LIAKPKQFEPAECDGKFQAKYSFFDLWFARGLAKPLNK